MSITARTSVLTAPTSDNDVALTSRHPTGFTGERSKVCSNSSLPACSNARVSVLFLSARGVSCLYRMYLCRTPPMHSTACLCRSGWHCCAGGWRRCRREENRRRHPSTVPARMRALCRPNRPPIPHHRTSRHRTSRHRTFGRCPDRRGVGVPFFLCPGLWPMCCRMVGWFAALSYR